MTDLLTDNPDVMGSLLRALCDPGQVTPRAPLESLQSWQRRAVIEHAVPYITAAERKRLRDDPQIALARVRLARLDAGQREVDMRIGEAVSRAAVRQAARQILLLPGLASGGLCPQCHGRYVTRPDAPNPAYRSDRMRCRKGHEWDRPDLAGPGHTTESLLRLLARGEALPDIPPKESTDA